MELNEPRKPVASQGLPVWQSINPSLVPQNTHRCSASSTYEDRGVIYSVFSESSLALKVDAAFIFALLSRKWKLRGIRCVSLGHTARKTKLHSVPNDSSSFCYSLLEDSICRATVGYHRLFLAK